MISVSVGAALLAAAVIAEPGPGRRLEAACVCRHGRGSGALGLVMLAAAALLLPPAATAAAAILVLTAGVRLRRARRCRRRGDEGRAMAAALELVVAELRVGAHPVRAFATAAGECPGEVGAVMRAVASRARLGADVAAGLRAAAGATAVPLYWERIAVCWQLAAEHGLAMAELMRAAQTDIIERQRFADRLNAALAGARATAVILALLPLLGVLLGQLIGADPLRFLLGGGIGGWLLVSAAVLIAAGLMWSDRIIETRTP